MSTKHAPELEVHPSEIDGWDVKHAGDADAISNFRDRESAIEAARRIADHEEGHPEVVVSEEVSEGGDEGRGVRFYFLVLLGLLVAITLIVIVVSAIGGGTEFGASDANLGE